MLKLAGTGLNQKKTCQLEILVNAYFTVVDGMKIYNKGRTVSWVVDSETYTLTDLERDIGPYFQWGSYQKANFWVLERNTMKFKLDLDAQLIEIVRSTEVLKLMMIVGRREEMDEPAIHKVRAAANVVRKDVPAVAEVMDQEVSAVADVDMRPELTEESIVAEPSNFVFDPKVMSSPCVTTRRMASLSPTSPGVTTRRMASLSSASPGVRTRRMASLSPASPGVTTRRMASILPGGINRRLIIE